MDLTNHYRSPYLRPLPHYRTYFPAIFRSCNPFVRSVTLCPRRIAFLLIFLMRTMQTGYYFLLDFTGFVKNDRLWILVVACLTAFTIELWNLHLIVEAEGEGLLGTWRVPAGAFSLFMFWMTAWHVWMLPMELMGMAFWISGRGMLVVEGFWIVVIAFVAWVAKGDSG